MKHKLLVSLVLVGCLLAAPAAAGSAEEVLARHRAFVGLDAAREEIVSRRLAGSLELGGMSGVFSIEMLFDGPLPTPDDEGYVEAGPFLAGFRYHLVNDLVALRQETYLLPEGDFRVTPNGELSELTGEELESAYTDAVFESFLYVYPSRDVYEVVHVGREDFYGTECDALEYRPREGSPLPFHLRRAYFAVEDGAFRGHRSEYENILIVAVVEEFAEVEGLTLPVAFTLEMGEHLPPASQRTEEVAFNPPLTAADFQPVAAAGPSFPDDVARIELPMSIEVGGIFVEARVNGEPCRLIVDTGAGMSGLDEGFAHRLGLEPRGEVPAAGLGGRGTLPLVIAESLDLGGVLIEEPTLLTFDLSPFAVAGSGSWDGFLGYEIFARMPVTFDYENGMMILHNPDYYEAPEAEAGRIEILPLDFENNIPMVQAAIDEHPPGPFVLDTGNIGYTLINASSVERFGLVERYPRSVVIPVAGFGGVNFQLMVRLERLTLGSFVLEGSPAVLTVSGGGVLHGERKMGNIGQADLSRFARVGFDYVGGRLILEAPTGGPAPPAPVNTYGFYIDWLTEKPAVAFTWEGSPAERAGLQRGDRLLSMDGAGIESWQGDRAFRRLEAAPGTTLELVIERDGEEKGVVLVAEELL